MSAVIESTANEASACCWAKWLDFIHAYLVCERKKRERFCSNCVWSCECQFRVNVCVYVCCLKSRNIMSKYNIIGAIKQYFNIYIRRRKIRNITHKAITKFCTCEKEKERWSIAKSLIDHFCCCCWCCCYIIWAENSECKSFVVWSLQCCDIEKRLLF